MEWRDDGLVLGAKMHGETSVILELMTREHGRHRGLVRGGRSRRLRSVLQPANGVAATWRARLDDHLGSFGVEGTKLRAAEIMANGAGLDGINLLAALLRLLPERDPHPGLYEAAVVIADHLTDVIVASALIVRFELEVLAELGFGLDLGCCALTGELGDLAYVSPKSGRAVSAAAGERYRDRLLPLPAFLAGAGAVPTVEDLLAGFTLTGHFLARDAFGPRALDMPPARAAYVARLARAASELRIGS
jgi:DNA repair protein RecO (recombination protein O)